MAKQQPEPWLRGTHTEVDAIQRAVLHALDLAEEDLHHWCGELSDAELDACPYELPSVAFQLKHIARSLDRLLSYAEGTQLDVTQIAALKLEMNPGATREMIFLELDAALKEAAVRVRSFSPENYNNARGVGKKQLPTTVGGLLVHCADHTQRHVGQAITTAKIVVAMRTAQSL
ncbi:MAG: DinB family protein [Acidobacteriaceae bacterium]